MHVRMVAIVTNEQNCLPRRGCSPHLHWIVFRIIVMHHGNLSKRMVLLFFLLQQKPNIQACSVIVWQIVCCRPRLAAAEERHQNYVPG